MKTFLSKVVITVFFLLSTFYLLPSIAHANTASDVPNNPHYATQSTIIEIMSALTCQLSGIDPINPKQSCLGVDQATGKIGFIPQEQAKAGGAIGVMGNMISMLYTPPLHTGDYFQNLAQNFGIAKPAIAQQTGAGFEGLRPLMGLWTAFRNVVYLIFVIVFVVIGVAIMLRIKIDPRTVMTIQNQIPKIIIGILLVTFSYAIAGFLIDMMYTSIYLVGNIITSSDSKKTINSGTVQNIAAASNPFRAIEALMDANSIIAVPNLAWKPAEAVSEPIAELFNNPPGQMIMGIAGGFLGSKLRTATSSTANSIVGIGQTIVGIGGMFFPPINAVKPAAQFLAKAGELLSKADTFTKKVGGPATQQGVFYKNPKLLTDSIGGLVGVVAGVTLTKQISGLIISIIIFLVILITLLFALFRLWFVLLKAYISILLDVVFAPFWIIGGIIPGSPISITGWLKDIIANLVVFPAVIAMFLLGKVFIYAFTTGDKANNFVPPLIGSRIDSETLGAIIGLGIILITPNILNVIKTAIKAPKTDVGAGKAIGVGLGAPMELLSKGGSIGLSLSGLSSIPGVNSLPIINKMRGAKQH